MKFILVNLILMSLALDNAIARSLNQNTTGRTRGNFGLSVKNVIPVIDLERIFVPSPGVIDPVAIATRFIEKSSTGTPFTLRVSSSYTSHNGVTHVYFQQLVNGLDVENGVANVNVGDKGRILSAGSSFFQNPAPATAAAPGLSAADAVLAFADHLQLNTANVSLEASEVSQLFTVTGASFARKPITAKVKYIQVDDQSRLAHCWNIRVDTAENMYNAHVDSSTGKVHSVVDWVADASYNVYPFGTNDPTGTNRAIVVDPANRIASPLGWHNQGNGNTFTATISNNVFAQTNPDAGNDFLGNPRPDGGPALNFNFPINFAQQPSQYGDAATTNLFYWNNLIHDLYYVYGFNEPAGNFQENNLGRGGVGGDAVVAFAQDGKGLNNANFGTPPDGEKGVMRMYIWNFTNPNRDGDLDNGIIVHEYTHGLSTRLTGGPANSNCLNDGEAGGLGEGWGDFVSIIIRTNKQSTRNTNFVLGAYVLNNKAGIRRFPYSTSLTVNPAMYDHIRTDRYYAEVHAKGEIWTTMLYEVYWNLVDHWTFQDNWFATNRLLKGGNVQMLQLVVDGMKLQPCFPTFVQARDAILLADLINNLGLNQCRIWKGFAKRGLGVGATAGGFGSSKIPFLCKFVGK